MRDAALTYLDMGELLVHVPSSGYLALFRRAEASAQVEAGGGDAFARRWEANPNPNPAPDPNSNPP